MENILIIGSSGHARVVIDIIEKGSKYNIAGLIDSFAPKGNVVLGYPILGNEYDIPEIIKIYKTDAVIIAIGENWDRYIVYQKVIKIYNSLRFVNAIHPNAVIGKNVVLGQGVVVMPGAIINSNCIIEDFCVINTKASLDHDSHMKSFSSLAPGVTTGGYVEIGNYSSVFIGSIIIPRISIGNHTTIGGGSFVNKSVPDNVVAFGVPAKVIRSRNNDDKYL